MTHEIKAGTVLIKDNTPLPKSSNFGSEPCVPGWWLVKDFDGYKWIEKFEKQDGHSSAWLEKLRQPCFGIDRQKMVLKAIERILANPKSEEFNSLEITRVASAGSERFPLVGYVTISAHSRHIQENMFLSQPKDLPKLGRKSPSASHGTASENTSVSQEPTKQPNAVSILSR
jgi:hypothetical protein